MRYIFLLLFLLPACIHGQVKRISDDEYLIKKPTLSKLDQAAKKSIQCAQMTIVAEQEFIKLNTTLQQQDTIMASQQTKINRLTNDLITDMSIRAKQAEEIVDLKLELKKEKKKNLTWRIISYVAIAIGGVLIFK